MHKSVKHRDVTKKVCWLQLQLQPKSGFYTKSDQNTALAKYSRKIENDDLEYFVLLMFNKGSAVAEMSDCLATIDMGRKLGAVPLLGGGSWVLM